ncbi:MAG: hypothetical protein Kow0063_16820 [Anaerolineae bacterium]
MRELPLGPKSPAITSHQPGYNLELVQVKLRRLAIPALAVATLSLGAVAGLLATVLPLEYALVALASLVVFAIAFTRAEFVVLLMLVVTSSVIDPASLPTINLGFNFTPLELCLVFLLGLAVARALSNRENGWVQTPMDLPVFLFFVASTLSFFNAIFNLGTDRGLLVRLWRTLFDYLIFFAVTNHIRTRRQLTTLTNGMLVMTTIVAALMLLQGIMGPSVKLIPSIRVGTAGALGQEFAGVARVLPPGTPLVFIMLFPALILYATPEGRRARKWLLLIPLLVLPVAIAFTFNRTWWIGALVALMIMLLFFKANGQRKYLLITLCAIFLVLLSSTWFLKAYVPRTENLIEALSFRAGSLFTGDRIREDQERRLCEVESAVLSIKNHPLLGVGPGGVIHTNMCQNYKGWNYTRYVHNVYLFILADLGILGFLPFLWFSIKYLLRGFSAGQTLKDPTLRGWTLGLSLGYVTTLVASLAGPEFMSWHTVPIMGVMLGINEVAIRLGEKST